MTDEDQFVAIIGMAGRFPGAADLDEFWTNLVGGVESRSPLAAPDEFDAEFFGVPDSEAVLLDPQHRVFLEICWAALEDAGHDPADGPGAIGVYAGSSDTGYQQALLAQRARLAFASDWQIRTTTGRDFLTSRVAYKLGLRGPAVTVQTACSTSLVAIHLAGQALLGGDCDLALAGGVTIHPWPDPEPGTESGDEPGDDVDGGLLSSDGHCRSFDAAADGTVFANGVGALVLKRLSDARRDGDHVRAIIRGSAVNNDGATKIGYTAPSVGGQAAVIVDAQFNAGVDAASISYVEGHGTGTPLGDPIEVAALTRAFRLGTDRRGYCALGSVKTNIGHVDAASGVAGVIKTVLALEHGLLPPTVNFRAPNPNIDFAASPFFVSAEATRWPRIDGPRRAGVSALGIGGTNAHLILEESGVDNNNESTPDGRSPWQLLVVSGRTEAAADSAAHRLRTHLRAHPDAELADVAWTLQAGRRAHEHRRFAVGADPTTTADPAAWSASAAPTGQPAVVFAFPGQGGQRVGTARDLYAHEPEFRLRIDECAELAADRLGVDLRTVLYPELARPGASPDPDAVYRMNIGQPVVFAVEYALAGLLASWGIRPDLVVGHSLGAYAAACVAGVLSPWDGLELIIERGRLLQTVPAGAMVAVPLPESEVDQLCTEDLDIAVVNSPGQCVVAGPAESVARLCDRLGDLGVDVRPLRIPVPAHSRYVEPIVAAFEQRVRATPLRPPTVPMLSESTGAPLTAAQLTDPGYWSAHLRRTVRFGDALTTVFDRPGAVLVEVGPGQALTAIARRHPDRPAGCTPLPALPHPEEDGPALPTLLTAVGQLWSAGVALDWPAVHQHRPRHRVSLPTYPFQRRRFTVDPPRRAAQPAAPTEPALIETAPSPAAVEKPLPPITSTPEPDRVVDGTDGVAGRVAALFGQLLGVSVIGPEDSFFRLGGDSVIAAQLVRLLRHTFAISLPLREVFRHPTVAGLAKRVTEQLATTTANGRAPS